MVNNRLCRAFTLIEMLVVIAIIGILAALIGNAVMNSIRSGRIAACTNNLKHHGNIVTMYRNDWEDNFPPWLSTANDEQEDLYVCPLDGSGGAEGSRADWIQSGQYAETNDIPYNRFTSTDKTEVDGTGYRTGSLDCDNMRGDINKCSYLYEFNAATVTWGATAGTQTWQQAKLAELKLPQYRPLVPVVRCYNHIENTGNGQLTQEDKVLNYRIGGEVNNSPPDKWWIVSN